MRKYRRRYSHKPYRSYCIFCHKYPNINGYYKCELTGQIMGYKCYNDYCKHGKTNTPTTFINWFQKIFQ
jgi:hypothetical protein